MKLEIKEFDDVRKGITILLREWPGLKEEMKQKGYIKLIPDYEDREDSEINYDVGTRCMYYSNSAKKYLSQTYNVVVPDFKNGVEALKWLTDLDSNAKKSIFEEYTFSTGIIDYIENRLSEDELDDLSSGVVSANLSNRLYDVLSTGKLSASCFENLYCSEGGLIIPARELPSVFSSCYSSSGMENICISNVIYFRSDMLDSFTYNEFEYEDYTESYSLSVVDKLNKRLSLDPRACIPVFNDNKWSSIKEISQGTADRLSDILINLASEVGLMSDVADCAICKLHMSDGKPVVSFRGKTGIEDYGITDIVLDTWKFPLSEVYFILSSNSDYEFSSAIRRLESNGEYTLTVF